MPKRTMSGKMKRLLVNISFVMATIAAILLVISAIVLIYFNHSGPEPFWALLGLSALTVMVVTHDVIPLLYHKMRISHHE